MKIEKKYLINKWTDWNHTLSESIEDFYLNFSFHPNIIEANDHTYSQFDFLINEIPSEKQKVYKLNDLTNKPEKLKDNEYIGISAFETMKASIDFAIDNQIPRGKPTRYSTELYFLDRKSTRLNSSHVRIS